MEIYSIQYYKAVYFESSPILCVRFRHRIPVYLCAACGSNTVTSRFAYPQHDLATILTRDVLKYYDGLHPAKDECHIHSDNVKYISNQWNVPVCAGSSFGPIQIKVVSKVKTDFDVLPFHAGLFARRRAVDLLCNEGIDLKYVNADAVGKYSVEADYVQIITPVIARQYLPNNVFYCTQCFRINPDYSGETILLENTDMHKHPIFATYEKGTLILSASFLNIVHKLGLSGFVDGKTITPVHVIRDGIDKNIK